MTYKPVKGFQDKKGIKHWGGDRLDRMVKEKDLLKEQTLKLLPYIDLSKIKSIADIGCGIGRRHKYFPNAQYIGFDREEIMIKTGKEHFPNLDLYLCDIQDLTETYPQFIKYFDLAFTFHVIQYNHSEQHDEIILSIKKILKKNALFYMKENTIYEHNNNIGYISMEETHSLNNSSYTEVGWIHLLKQYNFSLVAKDDSHYIFQNH